MFVLVLVTRNDWLVRSPETKTDFRVDYSLPSARIPSRHPIEPPSNLSANKATGCVKVWDLNWVSDVTAGDHPAEHPAGQYLFMLIQKQSNRPEKSAVINFGIDLTAGDHSPKHPAGHGPAAALLGVCSRDHRASHTGPAARLAARGRAHPARETAPDPRGRESVGRGEETAGQGGKQARRAAGRASLGDGQDAAARGGGLGGEETGGGVVGGRRAELWRAGEAAEQVAGPGAGEAAEEGADLMRGVVEGLCGGFVHRRQTGGVGRQGSAP